MRTGVTIAPGGEGDVGLDMLAVVDVEVSVPIAAERKGRTGRVGGEGVKAAVAGVAGRHGGVEDVVAQAIGGQNMSRLADAQSVEGKLGRD